MGKCEPFDQKRTKWQGLWYHPESHSFSSTTLSLADIKKFKGNIRLIVKKNKFYEQGSSKPNYVFMLVDSDNVKFSPWEVEDEEKVYTEEEVTSIIKGVISDCESGNGDAYYCMNRIGEYLYYNY